jgi:hypothetical protein
MAGDKIDDAIAAYIKRRHNLVIGDRTAEEVKIAVGSALPIETELACNVRGRDLITGLPKTITVTSVEITQAIQDALTVIVQTTRTVLERTPPELASDVIDHGIVLTGGGALLRHLNELITQETGVPCYVADNPLQCVAVGAASLEYSTGSGAACRRGRSSAYRAITCANVLAAAPGSAGFSPPVATTDRATAGWKYAPRRGGKLTHGVGRPFLTRPPAYAGWVTITSCAACWPSSRSSGALPRLLFSGWRCRRYQIIGDGHLQGRPAPPGRPRPADTSPRDWRLAGNASSATGRLVRFRPRRRPRPA